MFWRRSRPKAEEATETDDLTKLQKQFGIKPVSDADVQAEFQALFGATSSLSPTEEEKLLFGAGDDHDDEESKILRELQLSGVSLSDDEGDGHQQAKSELQGVLQEVHKTAQVNSTRQAAEMNGETPEQQSRGGNTQNNAVVMTPERAAEVHALKMEALTLKREGKIQEALVKFREAKQLQEQYSTLSSTTSKTAASNGLAQSRSEGERVRPLVDTMADDGDQEIEVTDEDMQDPEFLAQLAKMGLGEERNDADATAFEQQHSVMHQLSALETQVHECKLQAVQLKRQNQIADALACMRKMKELEAKCEQLRTSAVQPISAPAIQASRTQTNMESVYHPAPVSTPTVVRSNASAVPLDESYPDSENELISDIEVTVEDMNDPAFAAELQGLHDGERPITGEEQSILPEMVAKPSIPANKPSLASSRSLRNAPSIDEDFLIDAFDDKSDSEEETNHIVAVLSGSSLYHPYVREIEDTASSSKDADMKTEIADLINQLQKTRHSALALKRSGDIQGALESMRRVKQIEHLIDLKQQTADSSSSTVAQPQGSARDFKYEEIEKLLVDFGNRAMVLAKENLSENREKASEWLDKRKRYGAELDKLRQMRQNPLQLSPPYEIIKASHRVEYELALIPDDQIKVSVKSVSGLSQVAGKPVFVKFCLNFPSAPPHESQTDVFQINPTAPFTTGLPSSQADFVFKLARSRGTLRLFEIKKAVFEVWKPGTLFRNPELVSRAYQELAPLLSCCEVDTHIPFLGSNRKPCGGDIEIALQIRRPLKEKEFRLETVEDLVIGEYPEPIISSPAHVPIPNVTLKTDPVDATSQELTSLSRQDAEVQQNQFSPVAPSSTDDPHHVDLIVSYDVINEELEKVGAKLPSLTGPVAVELSDRYDSLALKKQLLEIEMQTGKLTLDMYIELLRTRISADRVLFSQLLASNRRLDAARVLHRIKIMQKELEGTEGGSNDG